MARKVFVEVTASFDINGKITPTSLTWEDGTVYIIDKVMDMCRSASLKSGGQGMRYNCQISGKTTYLFYENPNWFVEGK